MCATASFWSRHGVAPWCSPAMSNALSFRRNRHGGLFAPLTGDLFLSPTRAPYELAASLNLLSVGVPTPAILAYATYP